MAAFLESIPHAVWMLLAVGLTILVVTAVIFWIIDKRNARRLADEHRTAAEKYK